MESTSDYAATKTCGQCGEIKPTSMFYLTGRKSKNGVSYRTKKCGECVDAVLAEKMKDESFREKFQQRKRNRAKARRKTIEGWFIFAFHAARKRAKAAQVPFQIALDDIKSIYPKDGLCPVFGVPLVVGSKLHGPSLDRIIPNQGYVPNNIAIISLRANMIKRDATAEELAMVASWVMTFRTVPSPSSSAHTAN